MADKSLNQKNRPLKSFGLSDIQGKDKRALGTALSNLKGIRKNVQALRYVAGLVLEGETREKLKRSESVPILAEAAQDLRDISAAIEVVHKEVKAQLWKATEGDKRAVQSSNVRRQVRYRFKRASKVRTVDFDALEKKYPDVYKAVVKEEYPDRYDLQM